MMNTDFTTLLMEVSIINLGFWDDQGYYFNRDGVDINGGHYDDNFNYIEGGSYSSKKQYNHNKFDDEYDDEYDHHGIDNYGLEDDDYLEDDGDLDDGLDHLQLEDDFKEEVYDDQYEQKVDNTDKNNKQTDKNENKEKNDKNDQKDVTTNDKSTEKSKVTNTTDNKSKKKGLGSLFG